jgi:hypothetical protein
MSLRTILLDIQDEATILKRRHIRHRYRWLARFSAILFAHAITAGASAFFLRLSGESAFPGRESD